MPPCSSSLGWAICGAALGSLLGVSLAWSAPRPGGSRAAAPHRLAQARPVDPNQRDRSDAATTPPTAIAAAPAQPVAHVSAALMRGAHRPAWNAPVCFAYAPATGGYACLGFALASDQAGRSGIRSADFERWRPVAGAAWAGHKAVELVGPLRPDTRAEGSGPWARVLVAEHPYGTGRAIVRVRNLVAAARAAASRGYTTPVAEAFALPSGAWTQVRGARLRFSSRWREGDASAYAVGSLLLECAAAAAGPTAPARTVELLGERRGEAAVAFAAAGASVLAVGVLRRSGGEGSEHVETHYVYVDPSQRCGRGAAGPASP